MTTHIYVNIQKEMYPLYSIAGTKYEAYKTVLLTRKGLQFSLTYLPAEEFSSQSRRPR